MLNLFLIFLTSDMSWKLSNLQKHSSLSTFPKTYTSTYHDPKKSQSCLQKEAYTYTPYAPKCVSVFAGNSHAMHSAIFFGNIWPGKIAGPTLLREQLSSLKRQLSAAVWVRALGRTFQSWWVCETCLKNCLWLLLYLSFISPLRTVWAMSVNTNRILDSWRLENSTWNRFYTKIGLHFLRQSWGILIIVEEYHSFLHQS